MKKRVSNRAIYLAGILRWVHSPLPSPPRRHTLYQEGAEGGLHLPGKIAQPGLHLTGYADLEEKKSFLKK